MPRLYVLEYDPPELPMSTLSTEAIEALVDCSDACITSVRRIEVNERLELDDGPFLVTATEHFGKIIIGSWLR